jgi:hypothetical protein
VRTVRIWLILLLAALIPMRGAVAAAMLCLPAAGGEPAAVHAHEHAHHEAMSAEPDAGLAHEGGHHQGGASGGCTLCSACCSSASLLSALPVVAAPPGLVTTSLPDLSAPAPTFLSDGQERPPRSI